MDIEETPGEQADIDHDEGKMDQTRNKKPRVRATPRTGVIGRKRADNEQGEKGENGSGSFPRHERGRCCYCCWRIGAAAAGIMMEMTITIPFQLQLLRYSGRLFSHGPRCQFGNEYQNDEQKVQRKQGKGLHYFGSSKVG